MKEFYLKDAKFDNYELISSWNVSPYLDYLIFYKLENGEKSGFKFMVIEVIGHEIDKPLLYGENLIEILYWGYAFFDGIRHLYLGHGSSDNFGYINYPKIKDHINILRILRNLEEMFCRDI